MLEAGTSGGKRMVLVLAIVLLVALAGGAGYWYFRVSRAARPDVPAEASPQDTATPASEVPEAPAPAPVPTPEPVVPVPEPEPIPQPEPPASVPEDTDHDGLLDVEEAALGTDLNSVDTDFDGLFDYEEVKVFLTSPTRADSDGDGYADGVEIKNGFNPNGPGRLQNLPPQ
jgi:hypothetical protein